MRSEIRSMLPVFLTRTFLTGSFVVGASLLMHFPSIAQAQSWTDVSLTNSGTLHKPDCDARLVLKGFGQRNENIIFSETRSSQHRQVRSVKQSIAFGVDSFDMLFPSEDLALNHDAYVVYWNDSVSANRYKTDGNLILFLSDSAKPEVGFQYLYLSPEGQFKRVIPLRPEKFSFQERCLEEDSAASTLVPMELDLTNQEANRRWFNILDGNSETSQQIGKAAVITLDLGQERAISTLKLIQGNDDRSAPIAAITVSTSNDNVNFSELSLGEGDKNPSTRNTQKTIKLNAAGRYLRIQLLGKGNKSVTIRDLIVTVLEGV